MSATVRYTVYSKHDAKVASKRFTAATLGEADHEGGSWARGRAALIGGTYKRKLVVKGGKRVTFY